jgi:hypothetical protein
MGELTGTGTRRMYAAATWSVPVWVIALPAIALGLVSRWGLAGAGVMLTLVVAAAVVGVAVRPGVVAGVASGAVVAVGAALLALVAVLTLGAVLW